MCSSDLAVVWRGPMAVKADDIIIGDNNISIQTINGGISIVPSDGNAITFDSTIAIDGNLMGPTNDSDLLTFSTDTLTVRGAVIASTVGGLAVLDEDDMASDSETQLATQQSIKAYIDTKYVSGNIEIENNTIEDFVILRNDESPTYNLSASVDDHQMNITHIIRGDDHKINTFKQMLIYLN